MIPHRGENRGPIKNVWFSVATGIVIASMVFAFCANQDPIIHIRDHPSEYHQDSQEEYSSIMENQHEEDMVLFPIAQAHLSQRNTRNGGGEIEIALENSQGYVHVEGTVNQDQENMIPNAYLDRVSPIKAKKGEYIIFIGHGTDEDGEISEYYWESDMDGFLSSVRSFTTPDLSVGTHVISFRVRDDSGDWSDFVQTTIVITEGSGEGALFNLSWLSPMMLLLMIIMFTAIIVVVIVLILYKKKRREGRYHVEIGGFDNLGTQE
ncbi:MAG: hypothetical protein V3U20_02510 [Thermoplasmata archaeon]